MYLRLMGVLAVITLVVITLAYGAYQEIGLAGAGLMLLVTAVIAASVISLLSLGPGGGKALIDVCRSKDQLSK